MSLHSAIVRVFGVAVLAAVAPTALAGVDTFEVWHKEGACSDHKFPSKHLSWQSRSRINIATGEKIHVRLWGHGADFATDAKEDNIHEWIVSTGTSTDYPNAPIMFGQKVPKGYVTVAIEAKAEHGTGDRSVRVTWPPPGAPETIPVRIVSTCSALLGVAYRSAPGTPGATSSRVPIGAAVRPPASTQPLYANLLPSVQAPYLLARPLGLVVPTTAGGMYPVNTAFCANIASNVVTQVAVPPLRWGVLGTHIALAASGFDVQLWNDSDPNAPVLLDTQALPAGFPPGTPQVLATNYPGRPVTIRVIANPQFAIGSTTRTHPGCFTAPGVAQPLEPTRIRLVVDSADTMAEGSNKADNELTF